VLWQLLWLSSFARCWLFGRGPLLYRKLPVLATGQQAVVGVAWAGTNPARRLRVVRARAACRVGACVGAAAGAAGAAGAPAAAPLLPKASGLLSGK